MKKILLLGGSHFQVPSILKSKELGYYTITCDYMPSNPGHKYADEYHNISTTDKDKVLELAKKLKIDGIVCYASDPSAPTSAYVANKLGLASHPYKSVEILSNKDLFRNFLSKHGFNSPKSKGYTDIEEAFKDLSEFKLPIFIKPVDSSGSKGLSLLNNQDDFIKCVEYALNFSRVKRFIVEECIPNEGYQVGGDGFSVDGKLVFRCFNNQHFDVRSINPFIPVGISYPCIKPIYIQEKIHDEIQRLFDLLDMRSGAYNFEVCVDKDENIYIVEIGARNGGNLVPQITEYATGVDMVKYTLRAAMGEDCSTLEMKETVGFWGNYKVSSQHGGILKDIVIDEELRTKNIVEFNIYYGYGEEIPSFEDTSGILGIIILKYDSLEEMFLKMNSMERYVKVNTQ